MHQLGLAVPSPAAGRLDVELDSRWGEDGRVRVVFSQSATSNRGFLYAHDLVTAQYLILTPDTTRQSIIGARLALGDRLAATEGYLALAQALGEEPAFEPDDARRYWIDCVEAEFASQHLLSRTTKSTPEFSTRLMTCSAAAEVRADAEQLYIASLRGAGIEPVVVRYGVVGQPTWSARLITTSVEGAAVDSVLLRSAAERYGLTIEPRVGTCIREAELNRDASPDLRVSL